MVISMFAPVSNNTWIIDFCAIDYMIVDSKHISHLNHLFKEIVSTINGNNTPIIGK